MEPSLKNFDRPQTEPLQFKEHEFTDNTDSKKASGTMRRKLAHRITTTVAIALGAFLMTACWPVCISCPPPPPPTTTPTAPTTPPTTPTTPSDSIVIRSIDPSYGAPGDVVTIVLENFSGPSTYPYVSFGPNFAEVVYGRWGMLKVRVPLDLQAGSYTVSVRSNGQIAKASTEFNVTQSTN